MDAEAERRSLRSCAAALRALSSVLIALALAGASGCGDAADDGIGGRRSDAAVDGGLDGGSLDPPVTATDPCAQAGYFFDGVSDCDEVRCPELSCDCPIESSTAAMPETTEVTLHGCVAARGCLSRADCARICDPARALTRQACEARIAAAGALACDADTDCGGGECRSESVGALCIAALGCSEDGHCSAGAKCLFDPATLDEDTGYPGSLGRCSDGAGDSLCYAPEDCDYDSCEGQRCTSGLDSDRCRFNSHCASGFCRTVEGNTSSGYCVSGERGGACSDASDCGEGLHCTSGTCYGGDPGQICDTGDQCDSGVCVSNRCQSRKSGAYCAADSDCDDGFCVGSVCSSGTLFAPCTDGGDCNSGLSCAAGLCSDGSRGMPCYVAADCTVLTCANYVCSDGSNGSYCQQDVECASGRCAYPGGASPGECTSGAPNAFCLAPADCVSNDCSVTNVCN